MSIQIIDFDIVFDRSWGEEFQSLCCETLPVKIEFTVSVKFSQCRGILTSHKQRQFFKAVFQGSFSMFIYQFEEALAYRLAWIWRTGVLCAKRQTDTHARRMTNNWQTLSDRLPQSLNGS